MKNRILGIVLSLAIVATVIINTTTSNASEAVDISTYRSADGNHTAPIDITPEGKVFAGWYADATYKTPIAKDQLDGTAVPKWVDANVLTVKYQLTSGLTVNDSQTALRLVTTVDSLAYNQVGFVLNNGTTDSAPAMSNTVYSTIKGGGETYYPDQEFCTASKYFMIYEITGMPRDAFATNFRITPQWETLDGTIVTGTTNDLCVGKSLGQNLTLEKDGVATVYNFSGAKSVSYMITESLPAGTKISYYVKSTNLSEDLNFFVQTDAGDWINAGTEWSNGTPVNTGVTKSVTLTKDATWVELIFEGRGSDEERTDITYTISNLEISEPGAPIVLTGFGGKGAVEHKIEGPLTTGTTISFHLQSTNLATDINIFATGTNLWTLISTEWSNGAEVNNPGVTRTYTLTQDMDSINLYFEARDGHTFADDVTFIISNLTVTAP